MQTLDSTSRHPVNKTLDGVTGVSAELLMHKITNSLSWPHAIKAQRSGMGSSFQSVILQPEGATDPNCQPRGRRGGRPPWTRSRLLHGGKWDPLTTQNSQVDADGTLWENTVQQQERNQSACNVKSLQR